MTAKTYNVGIYCRLSNDDERDGESVSIENQKLLLQNYVRQRGWNEIDTYIDDGYSGTNFDRPGVKRLIEDAKAKRINVILVKDLSRFGRNYIEFGQYTDYLFPSLGCRFIALNNGIDTESTNGSRRNGQKTCRFRHRRCSAGYWLGAALWHSSPKIFFGSVCCCSRRRPCPRRPRKGGSKGL